ncbi:MAG: hypothetical protein QOE37_790, partial [Microbacteriaceae bacterium]|nr:hypothetical protein [Microbacteriaceae bacterium]
MYSEFAVGLFVGRSTFARADGYQRQGRVADFTWSDDRLILTGHVRGTDRLPYTVRVRLRATGSPELVTGTCDCPVGDRCKHVGALLLEALRAPARSTARPAGTAVWRRALDPILADLEPRSSATTLGLQFELQPRQGAAPGRFARSAPRERSYTVAVRPVLLGPKGRWRRTGISWREVTASYSAHEWNPRQLEALREVHSAAADSTARYSVDTWLSLERCHGPALWAALAAARREGAALITGGQDQDALALPEPAHPTVDIARTPAGLVLRPLIRTADGEPVAGPFALIGEPAIGVATWPGAEGGTAPDPETPVALLPFAEPVAAAASAFLKLTEPIRIPLEEE